MSSKRRLSILLAAACLLGPVAAYAMQNIKILPAEQVMLAGWTDRGQQADRALVKLAEDETRGLSRRFKVADRLRALAARSESLSYNIRTRTLRAQMQKVAGRLRDAAVGLKRARTHHALIAAARDARKILAPHLRISRRR